MPQGVKVLNTRKAGPFLGGELSAGQVGVDTTNGFLYFSKEGTTVTKHRPLTDAEFASIGTAIQSSEKGAANGVATLDAGGKLPSSQLPGLSLTDVNVVATQSAQLALVLQEGDVVIRTDLSKTFVQNGGVSGTMADFNELLSTGVGVVTFNSRTGSVVSVSGDYTSVQITRTDGAGGVTGVTVEAAIGSLKTLIDGKAESAHQHSGGDITSGDVAAARMQTNLVGAANAASGTISNPNLVIDGGTI